MGLLSRIPAKRELQLGGYKIEGIPAICAATAALKHLPAKRGLQFGGHKIGVISTSSAALTNLP